MIYQTLVLLAVLALVYSTTSGWFERRPINGALVYMLFGMLFGNLGLGWLNLDIGNEGLGIIAEITLGVVLFCDAAEADFAVLERNVRIPERLLGIGLPLTLGLGFGAALLLFDQFSYLEAAILATILAPTDAALGKAVISDHSVPARIRTSLNVESGLNDGICVPVLLALLALAAADAAGSGFFHFMIAEVGIGVVCGVVFTFAACRLLDVASERDWMDNSWRQLPVVSTALGCFALAQLLGGSGFIAAFCGGLLFGLIAGEQKQPMLESAEATGDTLAMITWVIFGAAVVGPALGSFSWQVVAYALLSLTVVRMLPVLLSLWGTSLSFNEKLFMAWFGPRGLASIVFVVIVLGADFPQVETIVITVLLTILFSVIAHGVTANLWVGALFANKADLTGETTRSGYNVGDK